MYSKLTSLYARLRRLKNAGCPVLIVLCMLAISSEVHAIPSPDLVINLSASIAQLLGLLSVVFGGVFMSGKKRRGATTNKPSGSSKGLMLTVLGILAIAVIANVFQYTSTIDSKNSRLQTNLIRKSVENGKSVGDTNLRTLSFSDQTTHSLGVTTQTVSNWLESSIPLNIIDVREDAEIEGGYISKASHVRYPDLLNNPALLPDSENNLLLCYSGNRSSELCESLAKQGKSCKFMIGGYEKWLTESRPLSKTGSKTANDLRSLPDFKNMNTLLDTPDVHKLVADGAAEFVDVRYPGDFELGHLPGAHNITVRALTTDKLNTALAQLPDKPLIAACYDKRSCFYSQLIGLSIDRLGKDFRGRYTVPHEYFAGDAEKTHVKEWKAANKQATPLSMITVPLGNLLQWLSEKSGHYVWGILLLVLITRITLLPLTLKSERDQVVQKSLKPELDEFRQKYEDHPRALSKATMTLYREHKIKPIFNLIASVAQLSFLLLFYNVVSSAANGWVEKFAWNLNPADPDPYFILPACVTVLFMVMMAMQLRLNSRVKKTAFIFGGILFFALLQALSSAVNLYLIFSMAVLIGQNLLIKWIAKRRNWHRENIEDTPVVVDDGLVPLRYAHLLECTGKKAARLGEMIADGYNVPDGFVFTGTITQRHADANNELPYLSKTEIKQLSLMWLRLKADKVAVRSSGLNEDGADTSFAGVYDSILNVDKTGLVLAVQQVYRSLSSEVASDYSNGVNADDDSQKNSNLGGVVVQKMVPAEYAGVMFTEHPANAGAMLVEVVSGLGEELVSGTVTPDSFSFGKISGKKLDEIDCEIDLCPLLQLGRELEKRFNHPQDIEWAYANGKFYLLQARDITRSICDVESATGYAEQERRRLLEMVSGPGDAEAVVLAQNELSELLPTPTPLSASFMKTLWHAGGSTDIACQQLGIPYDVAYDSTDFVTTAFGKTYINKIEERIRLGKGPGALAAFQLARNADHIADHFESEFLPQLLQKNALNRAFDYSRLPLNSLVSALNRQLHVFVTETYVEAEIINIAAEYYWKTATAKLESEGIDTGKYLNFVPPTVVSKAFSMIGRPDATGEIVTQFVKIFGHRSPYDYELSHPRYSEDPKLVINLMQGQSRSNELDFIAPLPEKKLLRISVDRVHRFQALKEEAKHYCMLELNEVRKILLAIDSRCKLDGQIFQLNLDEVSLLDSELSIEDARKRISSRLGKMKVWHTINPPTKLSINDLETMDVATGRVHRNIADGDLVGKRVAGDESVSGVARVITSIDQIDEFQEGEILVARMTDPQWYPLFPRAKGIVTEVGGWLSHAAIVAREYNLPAIVGVNNACAVIETGDIIDLGVDGIVVCNNERRSADSVMRSLTETHSDRHSDTHSDTHQAITSPIPHRSSVLKIETILGGSESANEGFRTIHDKRKRTNKRILKRNLKEIAPTAPKQDNG